MTPLRGYRANPQSRFLSLRQFAHSRLQVRPCVAVLHRRLPPLGRGEPFQKLPGHRRIHLLADVRQSLPAGLDRVAANQIDAEGRRRRRTDLADFQRERLRG